MKYYSHFAGAEANMLSQVPTVSIPIWVFILNQEKTLDFILFFPITSKLRLFSDELAFPTSALPAAPLWKGVSFLQKAT